MTREERSKCNCFFCFLFFLIQQYTGAAIGSSGSGSGGSGEEGSRLGLTRSSGEDSSASADPSSSEQSCDTVIYVGPIDDATDGEHPPVYLPSLTSGDNRCSMSKVLRGSTAEENDRKPHQGSPARNVQKEQTKSAVAPVTGKTSSSSSRSPQVQRKGRNEATGSSTAAATSAVTAATAVSATASVVTKCKSNEEQWIDGPRIHKSRMTEARNMVRNQREMWVDGPTSNTGAPAANNAASLGYGFMDEHKQGMIRQWVETQSAQVLFRNISFRYFFIFIFWLHFFFGAFN